MLIGAGFIIILIALAILMLRSVLALRPLVQSRTAISVQQRDRLCMTKVGRYALLPALVLPFLGSLLGRIGRHAAPIPPAVLHTASELVLVTIITLAVLAALMAYYAANLRLLPKNETDFRLSSR